MRPTALFAALLLAAPVAQADEVTETLQSAIAAYEEGDIPYALEELAYAQQLMQEMKAAGLAEFLPEAPEGWTREVDTEMTQAMGMMGGGSGAEATYSDEAGQSFTVTLTADNPMVSAMAGMFASAGLMGGKMVRVGREKFIDQEGDLTAVIDNRILIQASGAEVDVMLPVLEAIDYRELARFGL